MRKREPRPRSLLHLDLAAEALDVAADDVHADAPAGDIRGLLGGREARQEDQLVDLPRPAATSFGPDQAALARFGQDALLVEAGAIIADLDRDVAAAVIGVQIARAMRTLAGCAPAPPDCSMP